LDCFGAAEIARRLEALSDPFRWLLVQASVSARIDLANPDDGSVSVDPIALIGFMAFAGEGCEPMNCFLARYPEQARVGRHFVRPRIKGWRGSSFAKTQYTSTVSAQDCRRLRWLRILRKVRSREAAQ